MQIQDYRHRRDVKKITTLHGLFSCIVEGCIVHSETESVTQPKSDTFIVFCKKGNYQHHIIIQSHKKILSP